MLLFRSPHVKARPLAYPSTRYRPPPLVDLSSRVERERLSRSALKGFFNIMSQWKVRDEDARALLGGVTNGPFYEMKRDPDRTLEPDRLTRISYLVGIFKALNVLYSEALADAWVRLANRHPTFRGGAPPALLLPTRPPGMHAVRRPLRPRRAGGAAAPPAPRPRPPAR